MDQNKILETFKEKFNKESSVNVKEIFQFKLKDGKDFYLNIDNQNLEITEGENKNPSVILKTDIKTLSEIINNEIDGIQAFMSGKLKVEGNVMLTTRLNDLFQ